MGAANRHAPPATYAGSDRAIGHPVSCGVTTTTIASHPQAPGGQIRHLGLVAIDTAAPTRFQHVDAMGGAGAAAPSRP